MYLTGLPQFYFYYRPRLVHLFDPLITTPLISLFLFLDATYKCIHNNNHKNNNSGNMNIIITMLI